MRTSLRDQIIEFIKKNLSVRPNDLKQHFNISSVAIHRHLKSLTEEGKVSRHGKPPLVFYSISTPKTFRESTSGNLNKETETFLQEKYLYISPSGEFLEGILGFEEWVRGLHLEKQLPSLISEYEKIRKEADVFFEPSGDYINATKKLENTFSHLALDGLFYRDFYSLPKFRKTRLGAMLLFAKQGQNLKLIKDISENCSSVITDLIKEKKIDTVAYIPHSIPRQVQFLKEFEKNINISKQKIEIVKAYSGQIQVPQKSLSKLEERIINAETTFFLKKNPLKVKKVLLIDDAVGSGATMNAVASKVREHYKPTEVFGFAVVGSYKGFEVIKEV